MGLCSTIYKIIIKILVNKIKHILLVIISPCQSNFVPGRHITDNILIAQELIHTMHNSKGKKWYMAIKVDLEKAYDRLRWSFIKDTLKNAHFPSFLIKLIMECLSTSSLKIL